MKKNNNDFYERLSKQELDIPSNFDIRVGQVKSLKDNSTGLIDLIRKSFAFGYMQGRRVERFEREQSIPMEAEKNEIIESVNRLDCRATRIVYMFLVGLGAIQDKRGGK